MQVSKNSTLIFNILFVLNTGGQYSYYKEQTMDTSAVHDGQLTTESATTVKSSKTAYL